VAAAHFQPLKAAAGHLLGWENTGLIDTIPDILARIVAVKREELNTGARNRSALEQRASAVTHRDFRAALERRRPAIIAEIKKASPSKGVLAADFEPAVIARAYEAGGAAALSVLTDERFFQGSLADLEAARAATTLPTLRKDFTIDPLHVLEAAAHGADAVLLIAAILSERELRDLRELAVSYGVAALVEVHDEREVELALGSGATLIGVNNRDLRTFEVSLETSLRLASHMPDSVFRIAESGIHSRADIDRLEAAGYRGFLIGEHLMRAPDPAAALRVLACS
jgi:indole-3-glycerol phosphate synthase